MGVERVGKDRVPGPKFLASMSFFASLGLRVLPLKIKAGIPRQLWLTQSHGDSEGQWAFPSFSSIRIIQRAGNELHVHKPVAHSAAEASVQAGVRTVRSRAP